MGQARRAWSGGFTPVGSGEGVQHVGVVLCRVGARRPTRCCFGENVPACVLDDGGDGPIGIEDLSGGRGGRRGAAARGRRTRGRAGGR